jgi:hypothetical protein
MDKKTVGIVLTVISVLLCGCPGLFFCLFGVGVLTGIGTWTTNDQVGSIPSNYGLPILCVGALFIIIPFIVGFFLLRKKKEPLTPSTGEPTPPAV